MSYIKNFIGIGAIILLSCVAMAAHASRDCESWAGGHSIAEVMENGAAIKLEDGSIWRVADRDIAVTAYWQPNASIDICNGDRLTNTADGATIHAKKFQ